MKRFLRVLNWVGLAGAVAGAALFGVVYVADDIHELNNYGVASGPGAHTGYGALAEVVFIGLPAAGFYVLAVLAAAVWWARYDASFVKRLARVTAGLLAVGAAIALFEGIIDHLGTKEREGTLAEIARGNAIASDHDQLAAYVRSHDVNAALPGGSTTPLQAAVAHPFPDLAKELVDKGANVFDADLTAASQSGSLEVLTLLLDHEDGLPGGNALDAAYSVGNDGAVRLLVSRGVPATPEVLRLLNGESFKLFPGEVDWAALQRRWRAEPRTPRKIAIDISSHTDRPFPASEAEVFEVLAGVLGSSDFCTDQNVALEALPIDPWMKNSALCTCNYCPYARSINWAILSAIYPESIPPLLKSKALSMFRLLAHSAAGSQDDPRRVLAAAVSDENVDVVRVLEDEGFDIRVLDGQLDADAFPLDSSDGARMRAHIIEMGVRWRS